MKAVMTEESQEKPSEIKNLPQKISKVGNWPELYGLDVDQK